jgi:hypothetical protein
MNDKPKLPVVLCEKVAPSRPGEVWTWKFWCPFCARYHTHGAGYGHRVAHCGDHRSPFYETGYVLKLDRRRREVS